MNTSLKQLRSILADLDVSALLVTDPANVRWLTGFAGSARTVYVSADRAVLLTDDRYRERAAEDAPGWEIVTERMQPWLAAHHPEGEPIGVEDHHVTLNFATVLEQGTEEQPGLQIVATSDVVAPLRMVKTPEQIEHLRRACAITAESIQAIISWLKPGVTEREIANRMTGEMLQRGAHDRAFDPIIASGPNGSRPHHAISERPVQTGDLITMDVGALFAGYHADMTRTVALGEPSAQLREIHEVVFAAQKAGRDAVAEGVGTAEIDAACRKVIGEAGYEKYFTHGTGHGVGLEIHEEPYLGRTTKHTLRQNMTITVEPGIYIPGVGGVRIEDTVVVQADRCDVLTTLPQELVVV